MKTKNVGLVNSLIKKFNNLNLTKKNSLVYSVSQYVASIISFGQSFVMAKILGPTLMGEIAALGLITTYGSYLPIGTHAAMMQDVPYLRSKGETELAEKYKNSSYTFTILLSSIAFIGLVIYAFVVEMREINFIGFIILGACLPLYFFYNFNISLYRFQYNFIKISCIHIALQVILTTVSLGLVYFISNKAILAGIIVSYLFVNFYIYKSQTEKFKLEIDWDILMELFKFGLPLIAISAFYTLISTVDRVMILNNLDETRLGLYSFPVGLTSFYFMGGNAVNSVLYQKALDDFGKTNDEKNVYDKLSNNMIVLALVSPLIGFLIEGGVFFIIDNFLPAYIESKYIMEILIPASIFMVVVPGYVTILKTLKKHLYIPIVQAILLLYAILANYIALENNYDIQGVTFATSSSYFFYFLLFIFATTKLCSENFSKTFINLAKILLIFSLVLFIKYFGHLGYDYDITFFSYSLNGLSYLFVTLFLYSSFLMGLFFYEKKIKRLGFYLR